ncbi:MAG: FAD-dependent oxidoreductase [Deltaproteobacteria bacterium]|nr:FAD-dependent oxidoreductase [Deltaproteobacteria bacterium]
MESYDVIVCGGGAAGIGAAVGAAQSGARVALLERYGFLGGAATNSQVLSYCGFYQCDARGDRAIGGVGYQVLLELAKLGENIQPHLSELTGNRIILLDPEKLKYALDQVVLSHRVELFLHTTLVDVKKQGSHLEVIDLVGLFQQRSLSGTAFVDATGNGQLAKFVGLPCILNQQEQPLQSMSLPIRLGGLAKYLIIDREAIKVAVELYNRQAVHPIPRQDGGVFMRVPNSNDWLWMIVDLGLNDVQEELVTKAEWLGRKIAHDLVEVLRAEVAGFENCHIVNTGPQIGIRQAWCPEAQYALKREDLQIGRKFDSGIARAAWPMEDHSKPGKPSYHPIGGAGYGLIPLESLSTKIPHLWLAGRTIGADAAAYGSIRVMGTSFATGQAAGVAAALFAQQGEPPQSHQVIADLKAQSALV